jgi:hypothetical protein
LQHQQTHGAESTLHPGGVQVDHIISYSSP